MNPSNLAFKKLAFKKLAFNKLAFNKFAFKAAACGLLALILSIAGCGLLPKPAPAVDAFVPRIALAKSSSVPRYARLTVIRPIAPVYLDTSEPQLIDMDGSWLRIPGFRFAATPAELLQNMLADGLEQSGLAGAVLTHQADNSARIEIELRAFALERSESGMHAHIAYSVRLTGEPQHATRIEVQVPVASLASTVVRAAWQGACEQALHKTLTWLQEMPGTAPAK